MFYSNMAQYSSIRIMELHVSFYVFHYVMQLYVHRYQHAFGPQKYMQNVNTRVGTLIVATIYLQLIHNRYMFRSFTVLQCSHQHCVQPVASDVEVVGYL